MKRYRWLVVGLSILILLLVVLAVVQKNDISADVGDVLEEESIYDDLKYISEAAADGKYIQDKVLISSAVNSAGKRSKWVAKGELEENAADILCGYENDTALLIASGYLDLFNNVWFCVVKDTSAAAELTILQRLSDATTEITVIRMDKEIWHG